MERIVKGACSRRAADGRKKLLLVRLDAIGDYVLFRNLLRFLRHSRRFGGARLTVLGNPLWRDLAESFDADCADEWWWLSAPARYFKRGRENVMPTCIWRRRVRAEQEALREELKAHAFDCVISPRVDRDALLDDLVSGIAPERIGAKSPVPLPGDGNYTSLLDVKDGPFTFDRNRSFMEALTGERPDVRLRLEIPRPPASPGEPAPIVLCIGASHWTKRLPRSRLVALGRELLDRTTSSLVIAGGKGDAAKALDIQRRLGAPSRVRTAAGRATLSEFARLASTARCVISHDTGPMHIAAALGVPVVCIANGYSGKDAFWPYPDGRVRMCLPSRTPRPSAFLPLAQLQCARAIRSIPQDAILAEIASALS